MKIPPSMISVALMKKVMSNSYIHGTVDAFGKNDGGKDEAIKPKQILSNESANKKRKHQTYLFYMIRMLTIVLLCTKNKNQCHIIKA